MRLVAIGQAHRLQGHRLDQQHPAIRETMKGIRRLHGTAPSKKAAADVMVLRDALSELAKIPSPRALRDRALLLVGFAGALRRSELVALDLADIRFVPEGVVLTLRRRKTDQEGQGTEIVIPYGQSDRTCPVLTLRAWLAAAGTLQARLDNAQKVAELTAQMDASVRRELESLKVERDIIQKLGFLGG